MYLRRNLARLRKYSAHPGAVVCDVTNINCILNVPLAQTLRMDVPRPSCLHV